MACGTAPQLFEVDHTTSDEQINAALWVCDTRCAAFAWCQQRTPEPSHVMAGRIIDKFGQVFDSVTAYRRGGNARRPIKAEHCVECRQELPIDAHPDRLYCNDTCANKAAQRRDKARNPKPERPTKPAVVKAEPKPKTARKPRPAKSAPAPAVVEPRPCVECATPFQSRLPHARYCGPACKKAVRKRRQVSYTRAYFERNPERRVVRARRTTHCPQRHPYTDENTGYTAHGHRFCLTCRYAGVWKRRAA